jgi:hypothetical protein
MLSKQEKDAVKIKHYIILSPNGTTTDELGENAENLQVVSIVDAKSPDAAIWSAIKDEGLSTAGFPDLHVYELKDIKPKLMTR